MNTKSQFHGSDLEKVSGFYKIPRDSIINFAANVNPLGLSKQFKKQLADHLDILSSYPDREYTSLREAIGGYCGADPSHILIGNGSTELISLLIEQCRPSRTLILGPTYSEYSRELSFSHSTQSYYHLCAEHGFTLFADDLCRELSADYDLLIICNPNNPTSSFIPAADIRKILETCQKHHTFVMIDETYVEFVPDIRQVTAMSLIEEFDNFMILRGVSKFFAAPGLRLGYGATGNHSLLCQIREHQIPWSLNSIGAFAGKLMFKDTQYIANTRQLIFSERLRMLDSLRQMPGIHVFDAAANFILLQIQIPGLTASAVFDACIRHGLMIRDCSSFQCLDGEYIRFCIMMPKDNTRLLNVLKEVTGG